MIVTCQVISRLKSQVPSTGSCVLAGVKEEVHRHICMQAAVCEQCQVQASCCAGRYIWHVKCRQTAVQECSIIGSFIHADRCVPCSGSFMHVDVNSHCTQCTGRCIFCSGSCIQAAEYSAQAAEYTVQAAELPPPASFGLGCYGNSSLLGGNDTCTV